MLASLKLTLKQSLFVLYYLTNNGNATQAALAAGYKPTKSIHTTGWENLQKPAVKKAITELTERMHKKMEATYENKVELLWEVAQYCGKLEGIIEDDTETQKIRDASSAIKAISELNKMAGHYSPEKVMQQTLTANLDEKDAIEKMISQYEKEF